ncbi:MAG: SxtJ family membrane protein [Desulfobaccales bacterium]
MEIITQSKPKKNKGWISRLLSATPDQARDTGLALTLLCLIIVYFWQAHRLVPLAMGLLVLTMVWPRAFQPLAGLWFGLAQLLGTVMSNVILTVLFFGLVTPIGLIRRLFGADTLQLKKWKKGQESVFMVRADLIQKQDLQAPY